MLDGYAHCKSCGKLFEQYRPNSIYCSDKCRLKAYKYIYRYVKKKHVQKVCKQCNKTFETGNKIKFYCSKECQIEHQQSSYIPKQPEIRTCPICTNKFLTSHGKKRYCSRKCYITAKNIRRITNGV